MQKEPDIGPEILEGYARYLEEVEEDLRSGGQALWVMSLAQYAVDYLAQELADTQEPQIAGIPILGYIS